VFCVPVYGMVYASAEDFPRRLFHLQPVG